MTSQQSFSWTVPEKFNFAHDVLDHQAKIRPNATALYWVGIDGTKREISYSQMSDASKRAANVLEASGLRRGDLVILIIGKIPVWWEVFSACIRMGLIISPAPTSLTGKDLDYRIEAAGASAVIAQANLVDQLNTSQELAKLKIKMTVEGTIPNWTNFDQEIENAPSTYKSADTCADEESICYFTSGTTGYPKMTIHTHASYGIGHETTGKYWLNLEAGDLNWSMSDTGWAKAAWGCYFAPWRQGAAIFIPETPAFNVAETIYFLENHPIKTFCAPPTVYRMLIQNNISSENMTHLTHCVSAGEPLNPEAMNVWFEKTGLKIYEGYGQTETVVLCATLPGMEIKPGSMGKAAPGFDIQVIDNAGNILPVDTEGDIAVRVKPDRPVGLFKEYFKDTDKTAAAFKGDWYITGDRATLDADGYLWFVSRSDDVIISSGYRIGPFEVESALQEHAAVLESAVVSSPDEMRGEVVKAFVILADGYEKSDDLVKDLQDHVKSVTAPYKYPRLIEFVSSLPKTISGKTRRVELREKEWKK